MIDDTIVISIPVKLIPHHQLILREQLASATKGDEQYVISILPNSSALIVETPNGMYSIAIQDILESIIEEEEGNSEKNHMKILAEEKEAELQFTDNKKE
jgi:hypothetical protein